tara:strand:+ start:642 stop:827 length:186 start_codon:yes stop_codon:yes gene_type:complete
MAISKLIQYCDGKTFCGVLQLKGFSSEKIDKFALRHGVERADRANTRDAIEALIKILGVTG